MLHLNGPVLSVSEIGEVPANALKTRLLGRTVSNLVYEYEFICEMLLEKSLLRTLNEFAQPILFLNTRINIPLSIALSNLFPRMGRRIPR